MSVMSKVRLSMRCSLWVPWLLLACGIASSHSGSNTNWLITCSDDTDCDSSFSCLCGICSSPCDVEGEVCQESGAVCADLETFDCRPPNEEISGACWVACSRNADCEEVDPELECRSGVCVRMPALSSTGGDEGTANSTGGDGGSTASPTGSSTPACMTTGNTTVPLTEAMNYEFSSSLSFPPIAVAPDSDITFDWSALTRDLAGRELDANTEINTVNLMLWHLTLEEFQQKLNDDTLAMADLELIVTLYNDAEETSGNLFSFTTAGMIIDPDMILPFMNVDDYPPAEHTYTAIPATGEVLGAGIRTIQAFTLDPASTNTEVTISDDSTVLDFAVDLQTLESISVPLSQATIVLDWSGLTTNAMGETFTRTRITRLAVARYDRTPTELEVDFPTLVNGDGSVNADQLWEADVPSGSCLSLAEATNGSGDTFPGIDGDGTWMVALFCGGCSNPAPWFLSFLTPN